MTVMSVLGSCSTAFCLLTMASLAQLVNAQMENVALMKPAESSRLFNPSVPASVAVNGVMDNDGQCLETAMNDSHPYWRVDLGQNYTIFNITLYRRAAWSVRMEGVKIIVDSELCHTIDYNEAFTPPSSLGPPVAISVQCSTPLTGRYVTLVKNYTGDITAYHPEILSVCEVQVWATASPSSSTTSLSTSTTTRVTTRRVTTTSATPAVTTSTPTQRSVPSSPMTLPTTTTTDQGDNDSTGVFGDRSASPPETAKTAGFVGGVVGGVLGSLLILSLTVFAIYVVRTKRRTEQKRGDNRQPDGGDTDTDTAGAGQINLATLPSVAEGAEQRGDSANTAQDVYEVIEDSGHYYDPLSYRDNNYVNDNTLYTSPVFASSSNNNDRGGNRGDVHHYNNHVEK